MFFPELTARREHCVGACPVIKRRPWKELRPMKGRFSPSPLARLAFCLGGLLCASLSLVSLPAATMESVRYACNARPLYPRVWWNPDGVIERRAAMPNRLARSGEELDSRGRDISGCLSPPLLLFVSSKCRISCHSRAFTCRSQTLLPIHFNA